MMNNFPSTLHPMSQFSAGITAMQSESKFAQAYSEGIPKTQYWEVRLSSRPGAGGGWVPDPVLGTRLGSRPSAGGGWVPDPVLGAAGFQTQC